MVRFQEKSPEQISKERYDKVWEEVNFDYDVFHDWLYNNPDKVEIIKKEELGDVNWQLAIKVIFKNIKRISGRSKWRIKHPGGQPVLINEESGQIIYYHGSISKEFSEAKNKTIPSHSGRVNGENYRGQNYDAVFIYLHCTYGTLGGSCVMKLNSLILNLFLLNQQIQQEQEENKNNLNNDISQAQDGTDDDKVNAIKNLGKIHGEEGYKEQEEQVKILEEELMENNPQKYLEGVRGAIEENMKKNNLSSEELDSEIQAEYEKIKDIKDKINQNIGQTGAKKRFQKLKDKVNKLAKSSKEKVKKLKAEILHFINQRNVYHQPYKAEAQALLAKLESNTQTNSPLKSIPWNYIIPFSLLGILIIGGLVVIKVRKQKYTKKRKI